MLGRVISHSVDAREHMGRGDEGCERGGRGGDEKLLGRWQHMRGTAGGGKEWAHASTGLGTQQWCVASGEW